MADLFTRAARNLAREARSGSNAGQFGDSSIPSNSMIAGIGGNGLVMSQTGVISLSTVMACVAVLSNDVGMLPFSAYSGDKHGAKQVTDVQPPIVTQPFGPDVATYSGFGQIVISLALRGNAYVQIVSTDNLGYPTQVTVLNPDRVAVKIDDTGRKVFQVNGQGPWVGSDKIKHIVGTCLPGMITGIDVISTQRVTLGLANDAVNYAANFYKNDGSPSGIISTKSPLSTTQAREMSEQWAAGHAGTNNAHKVAVVGAGATFTPISVTPENAQLLLTRQFSREEICGLFGVPLNRIMAMAGSNTSGKGLDSVDQSYAVHTLLPYTAKIEQLWNSFLPGGDSTWCHFNFDELLRAASLERAQVWAQARLGGWMNRNEIRAKEGLPPIEGDSGTDYSLPLNSNSTVPPVLDASGQPVEDPNPESTP